LSTTNYRYNYIREIDNSSGCSSSSLSITVSGIPNHTSGLGLLNVSLDIVEWRLLASQLVEMSNRDRPTVVKEVEGVGPMMVVTGTLLSALAWVGDSG
jgi:hypothetical protein